MSEATDTWYYGSEASPVGPHTLSELQLMAASGRLRPDDLVSAGDGNWRPARDVPELELGPAPAQLGYQARSEGMPMVTPRVVQLFGQTSLWVRIVSIIFMIGGGFMLLGGVVIAVLGIAINPRGGAQAIGMGLLYVVMSVFYLIPAIMLSRYASRCRAFANLRHERLLEEAVQAQKSFWKYAAILMLIVIGLYLLILVGVLLAAVLIR